MSEAVTPRRSQTPASFTPSRNPRNAANARVAIGSYGFEMVARKLNFNTQTPVARKLDFNTAPSQTQPQAQPQEQEQCQNEDPITLEDFDESSNDVIKIKLGKTVHCINKTHLTQMVLHGTEPFTFQAVNENEEMVQITYNIPIYVFANWIPISDKHTIEDKTGRGGTAGGKVFVRLPLFGNIFITLKTFLTLINPTKSNVIVLKKLPQKERIGNLYGVFGISMNHGQTEEFVYSLNAEEAKDEYELSGSGSYPFSNQEEFWEKPLHPEDTALLVHQLQEYLKPLVVENVGGGASKAKRIYKGRSYMVRNGARGGRYILVGKEKKKIYI